MSGRAGLYTEPLGGDGFAGKAAHTTRAQDLQGGPEELGQRRQRLPGGVGRQPLKQDEVVQSMLAETDGTGREDEGKGMNRAGTTGM